MMKVIGDPDDLKGTLRYLLHGPVKKISVVCLEFDIPVFCKDHVVAGQVFPGGQPALGIALLGPGIGEIQIDLICFPFFEIFCDQFRISPDKDQVGELCFVLLFQGS